MYQKKNPKIYILSGKAKSGKNLVGNIIEEYYGKENCIQIAYAYYIKDYLIRMGKYSEQEKSKFRTLLQEFGVDFLAKHIDSKFLIQRVLQDIEVFSYFYDVIVITDARFDYEIEIPKQYVEDVTTIRIINSDENNLTALEKKHITEVGLDAYPNFDYVIENNSNIQNLKDKTIEILKGEK